MERVCTFPITVSGELFLTKGVKRDGDCDIRAGYNSNARSEVLAFAYDFLTKKQSALPVASYRRSKFSVAEVCRSPRQ